jgi:phenylpropionate dioxygenase-like ring-hydroxylating dioxygenase large terminal subunit
VAFRDTEGRIGLVDELCRTAAPRFLRPQRVRLRCVYHGWKFDVTGRCVDMMNEQESTQFRTRSRSPRIRRWSRRQVWPTSAPPSTRRAARFAWTQVPVTHRQVSKVIQETNWLQGLEGGVDTCTRPSCIGSSPPIPRAPASSRRTRSCAARRR